MAGILSMAAALKGIEKSGKVSRLSDDGAYRLTITRATNPSSEDEATNPKQTLKNEYVLEVTRNSPKGQPKPQSAKPELTMRFESLQKVLTVTNQALQGGLETLLLFHRPQG